MSAWVQHNRILFKANGTVDVLSVVPFRIDEDKPGVLVGLYVTIRFIQSCLCLASLPRVTPAWGTFICVIVFLPCSTSALGTKRNELWVPVEPS